MDEHDLFVARLAGLGMAGNRGGKDPGEEMEKAGGHGKNPNFKIQLSSKRQEAAGGLRPGVSLGAR
jgi:hypothetical protein